MSLDLAFTPSGRVTVVESASENLDFAGGSDGSADGRLKRVAKAFEGGQGAGLFSLATERFDGTLRLSFGYWRSFATRYLTALCHTPNTTDGAWTPVAPPDAPELAAMLQNVPPMQGAEYVTETALLGVWQELDVWVCNEVAAGGEGLSAFLKRRAPLWHQVGRVCFHLAENRRSEDYPFAFLATYAPGMAAGARIQYQPLSRALQEFAGAKNKQGLVRLLSPVLLASEKSTLLKELVD